MFSLNALQMFRVAYAALVPSLNSYNKQARITFEVIGIITLISDL